MPKPTPLYDHNSRAAIARQLNISSNFSGRSSYSYTSSQVPVPPPITHRDSNRQNEHSSSDLNMDVDETEDRAPIDLNAIDEDTPDGGPAIEVAPGVRVHVVPAKRYANSVGVSWISILCHNSHHTIQDVPLQTWADCRDNYLDECMALEGRGSFYSACAGCRAPMPRYRCKDCMVRPLWCQSCLVERHDQSPLHMVEVCCIFYICSAYLEFNDCIYIL